MPSRLHSIPADRLDVPAGELAALRPQADLRDLLLILGRHRRSIVVITAAVLGLALLYLMITPARYTATVSILVDARERSPVGSDPTSPPPGSPDATLVESQVRVISSDTVLRRVVQREALADDPEFASPPSGLRALLSSLLGSGAKQAPEDNATRALIALSRAIVVRRSERTYVIDVDVTSRDPAKAARLANDVAEAYVDDQSAVRVRQNQRDATELDRRLPDLQARMQQADTAIQQYKSEHKITDANGKSIGEQELGDLATELVKVRARTVDAKGRYDQVQKIIASGGTPDSLGDAAKSTTLDSLRAQYAQIVSQRANLETTLGSRHPAVREIDAQLRDTGGLINQELKRIAASAKNDYQIAVADEAEISRHLEDARRATDATNQALVGLGELQRTADASHAVYDRYLRARKALDEHATDPPIGRVIAPAIIPSSTSSPRTAAILAIALFGGLFFGAGTALVREYLAETAPASGTGSLRLPQSASTHDLALHVIASVPRIRTSAPSRGILARVRDWMLRSRADAIASAGAASTLDEFAAHPESPFSQAILALLEALSSHEGRRRGARTVLITSASEASGKTTIAVNLARAAMAQGENVLLIDGNPAHPSLAELLQPEQRPGLVELAGTTRVIYPVSQRGDGSLHVVPLLPAEPRIVARLERRASAERFDGISDNFDFVIIDGPTISAGEEARIAADAVDCIIVVTAAPNRDDLSLEEILEELDVPAQKFGGAVLSMVDGKRAA